MENWKKQHDEYVAQNIISLGPDLCKEYLERDSIGRNCHSKTASYLGSLIGNPSAWVSHAFIDTRKEAQRLVDNSRIDSQDRIELDPELVEGLEKTLAKYQMVERIVKSPIVFAVVKDIPQLGDDYTEHMKTYATLIKHFVDTELNSN